MAKGNKETWVEKHRAISLKDIKGQEEAVARLKRFILDFRFGKKAALVYGPAGSGKTSIVYALANDLGFEILELNASDLRNREQIESVLNSASAQKSLFAKSKILLIDEIDGIAGREDRGGLQAVSDMIDSSRFPVIMTANDPWQHKFNQIRRKTELVQLKEIDYKILISIMQDVCAGERVKLEEDLLKVIAIKSRGDVRAAINDLQSVHLVPCIPSLLDEREKEDSIFKAIQQVFKAAKIDFELLNTFDKVNLSLDDIFLWIDENLPLEFEKEELARAYDSLSLADVFRGRIMRQQHWRFLVYQNILMTAGIASVKKQSKLGFTAYKKPERILKIWLSNQKNARRKSIAAKIANAIHSSRKAVLKEFAFYRMILHKSDKIQGQLRLSEEERNFIRGAL